MTAPGTMNEHTAAFQAAPGELLCCRANIISSRAEVQRNHRCRQYVAHINPRIICLAESCTPVLRVLPVLHIIMASSAGYMHYYVTNAIMIEWLGCTTCVSAACSPASSKLQKWVGRVLKFPKFDIVLAVRPYSCCIWQCRQRLLIAQQHICTNSHVLDASCSHQSSLVLYCARHLRDRSETKWSYIT